MHQLSNHVVQDGREVDLDEVALDRIRRALNGCQPLPIFLTYFVLLSYFHTNF